jgi:hypothetical protein
MSDDPPFMNAAKVLGKVTGLGEGEVKGIWKEVKANHKLLDECEGPHDFAEIEKERRFPMQFRCSKCGGTVDGTAYSWYQHGLEHGRK